MPAARSEHDAHEAGKRGFYHRFAWAYDLIVEEPGGPAVEAVAGAFDDNGVGRGSFLVDAGCGTGTYTSGLAGRGFTVVGVDRSAELVGLAKRRPGQSRSATVYVCADFARGWRPTHPADGVLCRGVLNDLLGDDERQQAFAAFASWLRLDGAVLVDVREREASTRRYAGGKTFERTVRRGDDTLTFTSVTTIEPASDLLLLEERWVGTVGGEPVTEENSFRMRAWTWDSLELTARKSGFRRIARLDPDSVGARTDRLVAIALR
jgi:SAM-dependent methyltransferase